MDCVGIHLELFLMSQILQTNIFLYKDPDRCWNNSQDMVSMTDIMSTIWQRKDYICVSNLSHFQPVTNVNTVDKVITPSYLNLTQTDR